MLDLQVVKIIVDKGRPGVARHASRFAVEKCFPAQLGLGCFGGDQFHQRAELWRRREVEDRIEVPHPVGDLLAHGPLGDGLLNGRIAVKIFFHLGEVIHAANGTFRG